MRVAGVGRLLLLCHPLLCRCVALLGCLGVPVCSLVYIGLTSQAILAQYSCDVLRFGISILGGFFETLSSQFGILLHTDTIEMAVAHVV